MSIWFIALTRINSRQNLILIYTKLTEVIGTNVLGFSYPCKIEWRLKSQGKWSSIYFHSKFEQIVHKRLQHYFLTYAHRYLWSIYMPSTTPRHCTVFWVALAIPVQLVLCCYSSASVSCLQLLRGRPLFLLPYGFQVRAWSVALASWGCVRSSPTSSAVSAWPLVPVPLAPTDLHFGSSPTIGFCGCASDRC